MVTVVNRVKNLDGAKGYGSSPELRAGMQSAGVQGPPEVFFMEQVEESSY
jgi:hypothetical protein